MGNSCYQMFQNFFVFQFYVSKYNDQYEHKCPLCMVLKLSQHINLLKPTGYVMHQQFNIQQLYALLTLYLRVLYLSDNEEWLVPLTA
jgi:hypothetical protein